MHRTVVSRKSNETLFAKITNSPPLAPKFTFKTNGRTDFHPDVETAASSSSQPIKSNQLARTVQPVLLKSTSLDQQKKEEVKNEEEEIDPVDTVKLVVTKSGI